VIGTVKLAGELKIIRGPIERDGSVIIAIAIEVMGRSRGVGHLVFAIRLIIFSSPASFTVPITAASTASRKTGTNSPISRPMTASPAIG